MEKWNTWKMWILWPSDSISIDSMIKLEQQRTVSMDKIARHPKHLNTEQPVDNLQERAIAE